MVVENLAHIYQQRCVITIILLIIKSNTWRIDFSTNSLRRTVLIFTKIVVVLETLLRRPPLRTPDDTNWILVKRISSATIIGTR